jgi:hypothetical protein
MQTLVFINGKEAAVQSETASYFADYETYKAEGGKPLPDGVNEISFNKSLGVCLVNSAVSDASNSYAESVLNLLPSLIEKQKERYDAQTEKPIEPQEPEYTFEELKAQKLENLDAAFLEWRNDTAVMKSSLGFTADADTRAMLDIAGLATLGTGAIFMDADNQPHELTAEEIQVLQKEVVQSGTAAYTQKWALREAINAAETAAALDAIKIEFTASDFSA